MKWKRDISCRFLQIVHILDFYQRNLKTFINKHNSQFKMFQVNKNINLKAIYDNLPEKLCE